MSELTYDQLKNIYLLTLAPKPQQRLRHLSAPTQHAVALVGATKTGVRAHISKDLVHRTPQADDPAVARIQSRDRSAGLERSGEEAEW